MKLDLHIHTLPNKTINEPGFEFDLEALDKFVNINKLDCIAITNHNFFDYENFDIINNHFKNKCLILPGIEISLESGHILLIGERNEVTFKNLEKITDKILELNVYKDPSFYINIDDFLKIENLNEFMLIPHYLKDPIIPSGIIAKIQKLITAYEVSSQSKFFKVFKNEMNITPVIFSDFRAKHYDNKFQYAGKYIYLKLDDKQITFKNIKNALSFKKNVSLTSDNEENIFDIYGDKVKAYNGINVLLGKRSSGKTWLLNSINEQFQNNTSINNNQVLYIKQFEITNEENFQAEINLEATSDIKSFLKNLVEIFDYVDMNVNKDTKTQLGNYLKTLKSYAESHKQDVFSKSHLFNYNDSPKIDDDELKKILKSIYLLKKTTGEYRSIIRNYISDENLSLLTDELRQKYKNIFIQNYVIQIVNDILKNISSYLEKKSNTTAIKECNFRQVLKELYIKKKFNNLINNFKETNIKEKIVFDKFKKIIKVFRESNKKNRKSNLGISKNTICDELFEKDPFSNFLSALENDLTKNKTKEELVYLFLNFDIKVTDLYDLDLSGGQKSEFKLLNKLQNHNNYDVILIDEIENSFDNPFINEKINYYLKEIAKNSVIFISTHNNNIGVNLDPDYYIYCASYVENGEKKFQKFYGKKSDISLKDSKNNEISLNEVLIKTMEASEEAYEQRKPKYNIKN